MQRFIIAASAISLSFFGFGCQKEQSDMDEKLETISQKLDSLDKKLDRVARGAGAARPGQQRPQRKRPDPKKVYSVPVGNSPADGPADAKVTIVKAFEFACPYCDRVRPTIAALKKKYGDDLRVVDKQLLVHPGAATIPALAACAANKQGKYKPMTDLIWDKGFKAGRNLSRDNMEKLAAEAGLDLARFKADIDGKECKAQIKKEEQQVRMVGASGTPAFFINGRFLSGARPQNFFEEIIDEELKKANDAIAKGAKAASYYRDNVVKKGVKKL